MHTPHSLNPETTNLIDHAEQLKSIQGDSAQAESSAQWILYEFDTYYSQFLGIPDLAKQAFENRDPRTSLALSKQRLSLYSMSVVQLSAKLTDNFPIFAEREDLWDDVEQHYLTLIDGRYEADLAHAYYHSVHRKISPDEWRPVEYSSRQAVQASGKYVTEIYREFPGSEAVHSATVAEILQCPDFSIPYRDLSEDASLVTERINRVISADPGRIATIRCIQVIEAGFYRNRGAYIVGRVVFADDSVMPLIIALLNDDQGIYVDAVLHRVADGHNIFSSTLANFHVTSLYYHELSEFLHSIMPQRPLGLHYSTIGYNHLGKLAVMSELKEELVGGNQTLQTAVGFRGTVAIGFSAPLSAYNLKIIRNQPTADYKWGEFEGIESVLRKYNRVHEINRTGSMLDNIIYYDVRLDTSWLDKDLLEELLREAGETVSLQDDGVIFKHLIVQRRMTPLPVFWETASPEDAETAIINLGYCIKNNAAANIFNKDLDARNYGVSEFHKVYLFDYDALEPFVDVKIYERNDGIDGDEEIPEWFFEDGIVFLPEEVSVGLRIPNARLRAVFRNTHGDMLSTQYWQKLKDELRQNKVPSVRIYPENQQLVR